MHSLTISTTHIITIIMICSTKLYKKNNSIRTTFFSNIYVPYVHNVLKFERYHMDPNIRQETVPNLSPQK